MGDREQLRPEAVDEPDSEVFDRLGILSRPLAERVMRRAIELQSEGGHRPDGISRSALDEIAEELGVDRGYVRQALVEELETGRHGTLTLRERIFAPDRVTGGRVVNRDADTVRASVSGWMTGQEGLRPRSQVGSAVRWEKDDHWTTSLRMGLGGSEATGALRNLPSVVHRQTEVADDQQLVELDADTSLISRVALGLAGGLTAAGLATGAVVAGVATSGSDVVEFVTGFLPLAGAGITSALITAKGWLAAVNKGIDRALDGIANPQWARRRGRRSKAKRFIAAIFDDMTDSRDESI